MKSYYQIDRRAGDGQSEGYEMVRANNMDEALRNYLGADYDNYTVTRTVIYGRPMLTARCPEETSEYLEVQRAR